MSARWKAMATSSAHDAWWGDKFSSAQAAVLTSPALAGSDRHAIKNVSMTATRTTVQAIIVTTRPRVVCDSVRRGNKTCLPRV